MQKHPKVLHPHLWLPDGFRIMLIQRFHMRTLQISIVKCLIKEAVNTLN